MKNEEQVNAEMEFQQDFIRANNEFANENSRLTAELKQKDKTILVQARDWADEDTEIRKLAEPFLTPYEINGDTYGVPTRVDVVELLCEKLKKLKEAVEYEALRIDAILANLDVNGFNFTSELSEVVSRLRSLTEKVKK